MNDNDLSVFSPNQKGGEEAAEADRGEILRCHNYVCSFVTYNDIDKCPYCGRRMLRADQFRTLGYILIGLGVVLSGMGAALIYFLGDKLPNDPARSLVAMAIFYGLFFVGLLPLAAGIYQVYSGQKHSKLQKMMMLAFSAVLVAAVLIRIFF